MQEPIKELLEYTRQYNAVNRGFKEMARSYIRSVNATEMDPDTFWSCLDYFANQIKSRLKYSGDAVKDACHNTLLYLRELNKPVDPIQAWGTAAKFFATYKKVSRELSQKCWELPGVEKGDDSFGDWIDALPLAGRVVVEGIFNDDIANYKQVGKAVKETTPKLEKLIMDGENYVKMKFEEELIRHFAFTVIQLDSADQND